jgi:drug/metabolite transporter (DMT)-like permease
MFSALALAAAAVYGAADFIGGFSARRADTLVVVVISQAAGLLMVALLLPLLEASDPDRADWIWGGVAGLTGGVGVALLYRALAIGVMAVVAPITAVCAVAVPVMIALALGERPGLQASAGMTLALLAIVLVSQQPDADGMRDARRGIGVALASGVAIGLFFLALARTNPQAGLWPLLAARVVSVSFFLVLAAFARRSFRLPPAVFATAAAGGIVDMIANLLYLLASRLGPLTLVVTLTSLYPASTVLLARVVLGERVSSRQWLGVACALVAIVAIVSAAS